MINLSLKAKQKRTRFAQYVEVGLYTISDNDEKQRHSAMDVLLRWNPKTLKLIGGRAIRPELWADAVFMRDPWRVNEEEVPQDGDALWVMWSKINAKIFAKPRKTKVAVFVFRVVAKTGTAQVSFIKQIIKRPMPVLRTKVYDWWVPNKNVTGTLGLPADIVIRRAKR